MVRSFLNGRVLALFAVFSIWLASPSNTAQASPLVLNAGFNVQGQNVVEFLVGADSATTQVPVYGDSNGSNDNAGTTLKGFSLIPLGLQNNSYSTTFNAAASFGVSANGGLNLISASIFVDAIDLGANEDLEVRINGVLVATLTNNTPNPANFPDGSSTAGDPDNGLFAITDPSVLAALQNSNSVTVTFTRGNGDTITVDGFNIQAVYSPEPSSMLVFATAALGAFGCGWYRRRQMTVA